MSQYFECSYCLKKFVREGAFKKHECRQMKRAKLMRSPKGVTSYEYYCMWKRKKGHRVYGQEQFIDSKYFTSFFNFVVYARKMALPGVEKFIELMVEVDIEPKDWSQRIVYDHYMSNFDNLHTPVDQSEISRETITELARIFECEPNEVFLHIEPSSLIRIVQAKKLSPWFLLLSSKFQWFMKNEMTREQQVLLKQYVSPDKWRVKFEQKPEDVQKIRETVREMGL